MLKGVLIAIAITFGALIPPIIHFVSGPLGPFIGGYVGVASWKSRPDDPLTAGILFGVTMGLVMGLLALMVLLILGLATGILSGGMAAIAIGAAVGGVGYIAILGTIGAAVSVSRNRAA